MIRLATYFLTLIGGDADGRGPIVDARNGVTRSRIDLFAAVETLMAKTRRRAIRH
ncbi:MAG TPA: hypothetical protein VGJ81_16525 [Thermoanaerobaculia bacterium]|jgi:hypothetical protein